MDEKTLDRLVDLLEEHTGLRSPPSNRRHLRRALDKQARGEGCSAEELTRKIGVDPERRQTLINAVMIGETYFFREAAQYRLLRTRILPDIPARSGRLRCWSVSCSTGEEAVSLAVILDDLQRTSSGPDFEVYASDINTQSLERLRSGVFPRSSLRRDGKEFHELLLDRHLRESAERTVTVSGELLNRITVQHLNFYRDDLRSVPEELDFVFFRNTLLYATAEKREEIIARITEHVRPGGYLFLAGSELPFVVHRELELRDFGGVYVLQRRPEKRQARPVETPQPAHPRGEEKRGTTGRITSDAVLDYLNRHASELTAADAAEPEAISVAAALVVECYTALNTDQLDRAAVVADELCAVAGDTALAHFCTGWVGYMAGNGDEAIRAFDRALAMDGSFWPARFYRASLNAGPLDTIGARRIARREFSRCMAEIDDHERTGRSDRFTYLLEGFSAAYFNRMCSRWIDRITDKESA